MIILNPYQNKVLMPVPMAQWRPASRALPKDQFGRPDETKFRISGKLDDGYIKFRLWFDDRDAADAFMWDLAVWQIDGTPFPQENWHLPIDWYGEPELVPGLQLEFLTQVFLSTGAGSGNQTYTVPADWNNASNNVQTIGGAGSGGIVANNSGGAASTGGGGGAWNSNDNITLSGTADYNIGTGGVQNSHTFSNSGFTGNAGSDVWFNGITLGASSVGSKGGNAGNFGTGTASSASGGLASGGVGTGNDGGGSGSVSITSNRACTGGGGAAGPNGAGGTSANSNTVGTASSGGNGDNGSGGVGSAGLTTGSTSAGGDGAEWDATHGSGGGSGAFASGGTGTSSGLGGNYGAASGGASQATSSTHTLTAKAGAQGIIYINYIPALGAVWTNLAMMGM